MDWDMATRRQPATQRRSKRPTLPKKGSTRRIESEGMTSMLPRASGRVPDRRSRHFKDQPCRRVGLESQCCTALQKRDHNGRASSAISLNTAGMES